jgi:excisionase family DNA binding protein
MGEEKLLTVREVAQLLNITEKDVMDLADSGDIPAYKIGGGYLRFKHEQVEQFRKSGKLTAQQVIIPERNTFADRVKDFFYFNDFYIVSLAIILGLLLVIFKG